MLMIFVNIVIGIFTCTCIAVDVFLPLSSLFLSSVVVAVFIITIITTVINTIVITVSSITTIIIVITNDKIMIITSVMITEMMKMIKATTT